MVLIICNAFVDKCVLKGIPQTIIVNGIWTSIKLFKHMKYCQVVLYSTEKKRIGSI